MQPSYRTIFTEMLLAQSAAVGAFTHVAARCALLAGQQYQQAVTSLVLKLPAKDGASALGHPCGPSGTPGAASAGSANFGRAVAGLPRISMMILLSQYDDLRGRRDAVLD
jgi:hypothetical protein